MAQAARPRGETQVPYRRAMPSADAEPTAYWHRSVVSADVDAHARAERLALQREVEALRLRTVELAAALDQARAAVTVRHELLADQSAALAERDRALAEMAESYRRVVTSRRWRVGGAAAMAWGLPGALRNLRRRRR